MIFFGGKDAVLGSRRTTKSIIKMLKQYAPEGLWTDYIYELFSHKPVPAEYDYSSSKNMDSSNRPQEIYLRFSRKWLLQF
jgi:hypothetical protein